MPVARSSTRCMILSNNKFPTRGDRPGVVCPSPGNVATTRFSAVRANHFPLQLTLNSIPGSDSDDHLHLDPRIYYSQSLPLNSQDHVLLSSNPPLALGFLWGPITYPCMGLAHSITVLVYIRRIHDQLHLTYGCTRVLYCHTLHCNPKISANSELKIAKSCFCETSHELISTSIIKA